jgi:hypothetical protein
VVFRSADFAFIAGRPTSFNSSPGIVRTFCGACGTPLTYQQTSKTDTIDVTTVTLDAVDEFAPTKEVWTRHKVAWEPLNETLQHYPGSSAEGSSVAT